MLKPAKAQPAKAHCLAFFPCLLTMPGKAQLRLSRLWLPSLFDVFAEAYVCQAWKGSSIHASCHTHIYTSLHRLMFSSLQGPMPFLSSKAMQRGQPAKAQVLQRSRSNCNAQRRLSCKGVKPQPAKAQTSKTSGLQKWHRAQATL